MRGGPVSPTVAAMLRVLLAAVVLTAAVVSPSTASAQAPGDADYWSFIRKDAFKHYACKSKEKDDDYTVRTATFDNGKDTEPGVYTAIARGSNKNVVTHRNSKTWSAHYARTTLRNVRSTDRLWMQGAYYGPVDPWSDGFAVSKLKRCDPR
jgi:hypothetical protein